MHNLTHRKRWGGGPDPPRGCDMSRGGVLDPPLRSVTLRGGVKDTHMRAKIALKSRRSHLKTRPQALFGSPRTPHELAPPLGGRGLGTPPLRSVTLS